MTKAYIYPYKMESQSSKELAAALDCKRVYPDKNYHPKSSHVVFNWGNSTQPNWAGEALENFTTIINSPIKVKRAVNKRTCLTILDQNDLPVVPSTSNKDTAMVWLNEGKVVVVRGVVAGHGGAGISLVKKGEELPDAPLYTCYMKKKNEYRVHVVRGEIIDIQEKKKKNGEQPQNMQIRNHDNGWVFAREDVDCPQEVRDACVKAIEVLGLDFGAVDVGWNSYYKKPAIYEVNCAPGLEGQSIEIYKNAFLDLIEEAENY